MAYSGKRSRRTPEEKRRIVEATFVPGASIARVAREHGVNANQVFHWRKLYREGRLDVAPPTARLVPVQIAEVMSGEHMPAKLHAGVIMVEVGRARIRSWGEA